ncbi:hypothetical protein AVEN_71527-1 [Araneus ventricosus]|uniref:Uncharacterized protein n=1 Tax=Araneus ventricosus TaxID=182803 RepID=A0A4Y2SXP5_ARAVE|nr:hypothetical protein AVEN_71527-1 [Araneus ventricosus]
MQYLSFFILLNKSPAPPTLPKYPGSTEEWRPRQLGYRGRSRNSHHRTRPNPSRRRCVPSSEWDNSTKTMAMLNTEARTLLPIRRLLGT